MLSLKSKILKFLLAALSLMMLISFVLEAGVSKETSACGLKAYAFPNDIASSEIKGCFPEKTRCLLIGMNERICLCDAKESVAPQFIWERDGEKIGEWPGASFLGDMERFRVYRGDLDRDGIPEIIVHNEFGISNGLGIHYGTFYVLSDKKPFRRPLQFDTEEFGDDFARSTPSGTCPLFFVEWASGLNPFNDEQNYFIGRSYIYKDGVLEPQSPVVSKRYSRTFETERLHSVKIAPRRWFSHAVKSSVAEPFLNSLSESRSVEGLVCSTTEKDAVFTVALSSSDHCKSPLLQETFDRILDGHSSILLPSGYSPAGLTRQNWLKGKNVRVGVYVDSSGRETKVLRILEK